MKSSHDHASHDHIVFAGGGTAGHLFPGLAVAEELRLQLPQARITFAGTGKSFESGHVQRAGFKYAALPCRPLPRNPLEAVRFVAENLSGYYAARRYLRDTKATLVVGLGGYASVPAARAAARLNLPYVLLEQNAVPGRATRWLAGAATAICAAMDEVRPHFGSSARVRVTGNPLRKEFVAQQAPSHYLPDRLGRARRLVVLGGSGGSSTLNTKVPLALYKAGPAVHDWQIIHQTGPRDVSATTELYRKLGLRATVAAFIENMPEVMRASHLAVSRAGGTTLAELAASGLPAIVVPYPQATDDHQRKNADVYAAAGGAKTLDERELDGRLDNHLATAIVELATDHHRRVRMAQAMADLARPDATRQVVETIAALCQAGELATVEA